jgi:subtilisin family serine protease
MFNKEKSMKPKLLRLFALIMVLSLIVTPVSALPVTETSSVSKDETDIRSEGETNLVPQVEPELLNQIASDESSGYLIYFREKANLSEAYNLDWEARGWYVMETLQAVAERSQTSVRSYLDSQRAVYQAFWIDNVIVVERSDLNTFNGLLGFTEIESILARRHPVLIEPVNQQEVQSIPFGVESNLEHIQVPEVWDMGFFGDGIVVANIDTGVRYTHNALVNQYRGNLGGGSFEHNYNWYDPYTLSPAPNDVHNHGSHTAGTMIGDDGGDNQIGVAPGAQWIACKGFNPGATDAGLLACGQFMAAPTTTSGTNPNTDLRPHVVNNSWGDCQQTFDPWYDGVLAAWHAGGIYPVFSNGNASNCGYSSPPGLNTVGNPARAGNVTGVGSTGTNNGQYATYSNWGPTDNPDTINLKPGWADLKPQVLAPGTNRSAGKDSDTHYYISSGTSMAGPHVAGLIALMWSAAPPLIGDYSTTETIIEDTATPIYYDDLGTGARWPNYATGWGEINALAAVLEAIAQSNAGTLQGTVTDSLTSDPISSAQVEMVSDEYSFTAFTDTDGFYSRLISEDTYTVTVSAYGYFPATETDVEVIEDQTTVKNFSLVPAPAYMVSGTVTDINTGWPLYAEISIEGYPGDPVWSAPDTGYYSIELVAGTTYTFHINAWVDGYRPESRDVLVMDNQTEDFELSVDVITCTAPGYEPAFIVQYYEDFEANDGGYLSSGTPEGIWQWGSPVTWPSYCAIGDKCWGTNLDGNYPDDANIVLTSPVIDLTATTGDLIANWWQAWHIESVTWDKAYAEVSINSGPWQIMWEHTSPTVQVNWTSMSYDISAASGGEVQFRFRLISDYVFGYNGYYIDDIEVAKALCLPTPGGLVMGNVYDGNTADPLVGALVETEDGYSAVAQATPGDPNLEDAFYLLFSSTGLKEFTASFNGYGDSVKTVSVITDTVTLQDFDLPAGWLLADPDALSITVELGSTDNLTLDLNNLGGLPAEFEFKEKDEGYSPVITAGEDILVVRYESLNADAMQATLTALGISFNPVTDSVFRTIPVSELLEYEAVFYAGVAPVDSLPYLIDYLDAGGSLLIADNDLGYFRGTTTFYQVYLQATYNADDGGDFLTGEGLMAGLDLDISADPFPDDFIVGAEGQRIFKFTTSDYAGGAAIERMDYRAIYLSFDFHRVAGEADREELLTRVLDFLVAADVPWLEVTPMNGTIPAYDTLVMNASFNASIPEVTQPGVYLAKLRVSNNTPYGRFDIPVTMNVTAPENYGFWDGTVTSLGYCDENPGLVQGAEVLIEDDLGMSWTLITDKNGYYQIWLDEAGSPFTVTVTAPEHEIGYADEVEISGQQTTTFDFDLRWLKPCLTVEPEELIATLVLGETDMHILTLGNWGAVDLDFELIEIDGGYTPWLAVEAQTDQVLRSTITSGNPYLAEIGQPSGKPVIGPASGGPAPEDIGDAWETMVPLPAGRVFNAVIADENGYVYVIGGTSDAGGLTPTSTNYRYNTNTNTWDTMAPIPVTMDSIDGISINNKIYIPGDTNTATTYVYEIATDTWSTIAANGGYTARSQYQVVSIGSDLYVLGGITAGASTTQVWVLDTTTEIWSAGVSMQKSRTSFSAAAIDGEIYVAGGVAFPGFTPDMTAEKFDGTSWSYIASLPDGGGAYTRWSYNADGHGADGLWLAGGRRDAGWGVLNHAGYYDPDTDTWTDSPTIPILNQGRVYVEGDVASDGYFYVIGGRDSAGAIIYATNERLYVGSSAVGDVPWFSTNPTSGSVDPDGGEVEVEVTFDAGFVSQLGEYNAILRIRSNDPQQPSYNIPVTMNVVAIAYGVELTTEDDAFSAEPGETVDYTLTLTNRGNVPDTFALSIAGNDWDVDLPDEIMLAAGESVLIRVDVTIPANAEDGDSDMVTVTATSTGDASQFASLELTTTAVVPEPDWYFLFTPLVVKN